MVPQHGPFSLHTMLEGPWLPKTLFPTPMVRPLDESQGSSPLQSHGSWLVCEVTPTSFSLAFGDVHMWFHFEQNFILSFFSWSVSSCSVMIVTSRTPYLLPQNSLPRTISIQFNFVRLSNSGEKSKYLNQDTFPQLTTFEVVGSKVEPPITDHDPIINM